MTRVRVVVLPEQMFSPEKRKPNLVIPRGCDFFGFPLSVESRRDGLKIARKTVLGKSNAS
jgi:hypothetical protein